MKKVFFVPDMHMPYHDRKAWSVMRQIMSDWQPDEVVLIGDFADCYSVSSHAKDPQGARNIVKELKPVKESLQHLRNSLTKSKIVYIEGNHEYRLPRYIRDRAPEMEGIATIPNLLGLDALGIHWIPYTPNQKYQVCGSTLYARHEPYGASGAATLSRGKISIVTGHNHKVWHHTSTAANGKTYRHISCGHGADTNSYVMHYLKNPADWQHGYASAYIFPNRNFVANANEIMEGRTVFEGKLYTAK